MMTEAEGEQKPIRVKMRVGNVEFEIEGTVDQANEAVGKFLQTVTEKLKETPLMTEKEAAPSRETCKVIIQRLWEEGWFSSERGLGEVHSEMARRGFHYDRTAVAHALIDLVKDGVLNREGRPRRYQYVQKRPPSSR
jgi:predicted transcriptional regulator